MAVLCMLSSPARALEYKTGPAPAWVLPIIPDVGAQPGGQLRGEQALLSDVQARIEPSGKTTYLHYANKALDSHGVEQAADISMSFDPTYQALTLHSLRVVRDGKVIDKLGEATIRVLQREKELEYQIYDGSKTVNVVLDDLRVGDVVEYAYSLSGLNPVFKNRVTGGAPLQWSVPVDRAYVRLLVPSARQVAVVPRNTAMQPIVSVAGGYRDYQWDVHQVPGLKVEKDAPASYDPYAGVQWSEFADWQAVVRWAVPLFHAKADNGAALAREVERIKQSSSEPTERLLAVLHLVQRDVRYLGVEVGPGSHAPTPPELVFKRRFGDCKDKALLTATLLQALGVDAQPALVNTELREHVADLIASPNAFNHAIVRARIGASTYWIDPTRALQKGDLSHLAQSDYGVALVIDPSSRGLEPMRSPVQRRTVSRAFYDLTDSLSHPARLTVTTTEQGRAADYLRAELAGRGQAEMELQYLNFYARRYPGIKLAAPLGVSDDDASNTLTVVERYVIADFWGHSGSKPQRETYIQSAELASILAQPDAMNRIAPLQLDFPREIEELTEVRLPHQWMLEPDDVEVSDPAFTFSHHVVNDADGRRFVTTDRYKTLASQVDPYDMKAYAAHLKTADGVVGTTLTLPDASTVEGHIAGKFHWKGVAAVVMMVAWTWLGLLWQTSPPPHRRTDGRLLGCFIGATGLLLLLALLPLSLGYQLVCALVVALAAYVLAYRIARNAPASHRIYTLAHTVADPERTLLARLLGELPKLLIWLAAFGVIAVAVAGATR